MRRRLLVLALMLLLVGLLATLAALQADTGEVEAQTTAYPMSTICLEYTTGLYKGTFSGSCPPGHQKLSLPDAYPLILCASFYDSFLRKPLPNGQCPSGTRVRIELPSSVPYAVCYVYATGRLRVPVPYPNGACTAGSRAVTFPSGFEPQNDTYQTLGNVDIAVPAGAGVLSNDGGQGLSVTAFDAASTNGGTVVVNPNGSFTYTPPAPSPNAFSGNDSFSYIAEDGAGNSGIGTVTIQVLGPAVWFVDADALDPGDGRRLTPFTAIDAVNDDGADPDQPGDVIFLYEATASYLALIGGFNLEDGQYIVGQEVDLAEILEQLLSGTSMSASGSSLQGNGGTPLPPYVVLPPENPTSDVPTLTNSDALSVLSMANDSSAVGFFIDGALDQQGVFADLVENTTLDRMDVTVGGDFDGSGEIGVGLSESSMTIVNSIVRGGDGASVAELFGSTLQLIPVGGDGGDAIASFDSMLTVIDSTIEGGDGGSAETLSATAPTGEGSTLQSGGSIGGNAGDGIEAQVSGITVTDSSVTGGAGGTSGEAGEGGLGIFNTGILFGRGMQGPPVDPFPFISVSNSTIAGGASGNAFTLFGRDGGAGIAGILVQVEVLDGSIISGGNGGDGTVNGGLGGNGIDWETPFIPSGLEQSELQGPPIGIDGPVVSVVDSTVNGGDGGSSTVSGNGGNAGIGILMRAATLSPFMTGSSLAGDIGLTALFLDGATVNGGEGGQPGGSAASGGSGGHGVVLLSETGTEMSAEQTTLQGFTAEIGAEVIDSTVTGGIGGAGLDGNGGEGGDGIIAATCEFCLDSGTTGASALQGGTTDFDLEISGSTISAGAGADGSTRGGNGGNGITNFPPVSETSLQLPASDAALQGIAFEALDLAVFDTTVSGGDGGNGAEAGFGGHGIQVEETDALVDDASTVTGGAGGDGESAGGGGSGILIFDSSLLVDAGSDITGGDGGNASASPATGGDGIRGTESFVEIVDSSASGGAGSNGSASAQGGVGGSGIFVGNVIASTLEATNATITGGDGGSSATTGGNGGAGAVIEDANGFVSGGSSVTGGDGGAASGAGGSAAVALLYAQTNPGNHVVDVQASTLAGGDDESGQADSLYIVQANVSGNVCVNALNNTPSGNFTLDNAIGGILGISQTSIAAMSTDNAGVTVNPSGTITFDCVFAP